MTEPVLLVDKTDGIATLTLNRPDKMNALSAELRDTLGGFEISLSCDMLIATPEAAFADTHARVGLLAGWGLSQRLSRAIGINRAKELSLTGNYLPADRAYEWGLVNRVVSRDELLPTCRSLARDMLSCVPEAMRQYKRMIDRGYDLALGDAMTYEVEVSRMHQSPAPETVAERLPGIRNRGRDQAYGSDV